MFTLAEIKEYCKKNGKQKLIFDTNLLVLLIVHSSCGDDFLCKCSLTSKYTKNDVILLKDIFKYFDSTLIVASHTIAELSNLVRSLPDHKHHYLFFQTIERLKHCNEKHISIDDLIKIEVKTISRFGFPDMAIIEIAKEIKDSVIFTDEIDLFVYAQSLNMPSINFTNIKTNILFQTQS